MKRKISLFLIFCLLLSVLCGCSSSVRSWIRAQYGLEEVEEEPEEEQSVAETVSVAQEISVCDSFGLAYQQSAGLDPYACKSLTNRVILSFLYEPLFAITIDGSVTPWLAESWSVSSDELTTTVTLNSAATFSDGSSVTAADVVYSLSKSRGSSYYGQRLSDVYSITASDEKTVVLSCQTPHECLPLLLDIPIIKENSMNPDGSAVGSGPYVRDNFILKRCDNWWQNTSPLLDAEQISLVAVNSATDIRDAFDSGEITLVQTDPNQDAYVSYHSSSEVWVDDTTVLDYLGYNLSSLLFSNSKLRAAMTYAVNRSNLVSSCMGGFGQVAVLPCQKEASFYDAGLAADYAYNLETFFDALDEAEIRDSNGDGILETYVSGMDVMVPLSASILVCSDNRNRVLAAQEIADELNSCGFDLSVQELDTAAYQKALADGDFDLYYGEVRLPANYDLSAFFGDGGALSFGSLSAADLEDFCNLALTNNGNFYNLYQTICQHGYLTPVLFRSLAVYTVRGSVGSPTTYLDWFLPER